MMKAQRHWLRVLVLAGAVGLMGALLRAGGGARADAAAPPSACLLRYSWRAAPAVWAAGGSIKVLRANNAQTNAPVFGVAADAGWTPPAAYTAANPAWNGCTRVVTLAGARREVLSFQLFVTAPPGHGVADLTVGVSPLRGPGGAVLSSNADPRTSDVVLYREAYVPALNGSTEQPTGTLWPDPLIPFRDPYNPVRHGQGWIYPRVGVPFSVPAGTTQGVWVNVHVPPGQAPGMYAGRITVSGARLKSRIALSVAVWRGTLPRFDSPNRPGMLKAWVPLYMGRWLSAEGIACVGGYTVPSADACPALDRQLDRYLRMAHRYDFDTQLGEMGSIGPTLSAGTCAPYAPYRVDWQSFDQLYGPALSGTLFRDRAPMRVIAAPLQDDWAACGWSYQQNTRPPAVLLRLLENYSAQISAHFAAMRWPAEILAYIFDEPQKRFVTHPLLASDIAAYAQAINTANGVLAWRDPVRMFLTAAPGCAGPSYPAESSQALAICQAEQGWSYPSSSLPDSWVLDVVPNSSVYVPGHANAFTMGSVAAMSTAPTPIERWFYQGDFLPSDTVNASGTALRTWFWIAYKYHLSGVFLWAANFWENSRGGDVVPNACAAGNPYSGGALSGGFPNGNGVLFYPGNELDCVPGVPDINGGMHLGANASALQLAQAVQEHTSAGGGISGPVPSIRMEEWRAGYQDYEYLYLLHQHDLRTGEHLATAVVDSMSGEGVPAWGALNYQGLPRWWYTQGNAIVQGACRTANLPSGPTGAWHSHLHCPGEWTHNPDRFFWARIAMAQDLGWLRPTVAEVRTVSPAAGPPWGGSAVTVRGSGFAAVRGVTFGGVPARAYRVLSATKMVVTAPPGSGSVTIRVQVLPGVASRAGVLDRYTYTALPVVEAVSPGIGPSAGGTRVTVCGANFGRVLSVRFGGASAAFRAVTAGCVAAVAPRADLLPGYTGVNVRVTTSAGTSTVGVADEFQYAVQPVITDVSPGAGPDSGGTAVVLYGHGFIGPGHRPALEVDFGTDPAERFTVISSQRIVAVAPAGRGSVFVSVTVRHGTSADGAGARYIYRGDTPPGPRVVSVTPSRVAARGLTVVVIDGTGFVGVHAVRIGGILVRSFHVDAPSQITAVLPACRGGDTVTVVTASGISRTGAGARVSCPVGQGGGHPG